MKTSKMIFLLSYLCMASVTSTIISPALPTIAQNFQVDIQAINWVNSIFLFGYMAGQLVYGPLANRYGRLFALRIGIVTMIMGILLTLQAAFTLHYGLFIFGRFITALGAASGLACTFMLLVELLPATQSTQAMAYGPLFFTLGIGGSAFIGGWVSQHYNWQATCYLLLCYGVIMLAGTLIFKEPMKNSVKLNIKTLIDGYKSALKSRQLLIFSFCVGLVSLFAYGYSTVAPIFAIQQLKLSSFEYGQWNLINMLGMGGSSMIGAYLIAKIGHQRLLKLALLALIPGLMALCWLQSCQSPSVVAFFLTTTWLYLFSGLIFPAGSYFATQAIEDKASASSMMSCINIGTAFIGLTLLGHIPMNMLAGLLLLLIAALSLCLISTTLFFKQLS